MCKTDTLTRMNSFLKTEWDSSIAALAPWTDSPENSPDAGTPMLKLYGAISTQSQSDLIFI